MKKVALRGKLRNPISYMSEGEDTLELMQMSRAVLVMDWLVRSLGEEGRRIAL